VLEGLGVDLEIRRTVGAGSREEAVELAGRDAFDEADSERARELLVDPPPRDHAIEFGT
jgi:hypothetical protein